MNCIKLWGDKPYNNVNYFYRKKYGQKIYKLSLNAGLTCPNRDGTLGLHGCIFCSAGGSGDFASNPHLSIHDQIIDAKKRVQQKMKHQDRPLYIAYFQAFTNTYAPVSVLRSLYMQAIDDSSIVGLTIATRPDCLSDNIIDLLVEINKIKPVTIELGLQTIDKDIAIFIRRGYTLSIFEDAVDRLSNVNIPTVVHLIIGLPGETHELLYRTINYINSLSVQGVKFTMLHILKGTDLADYYNNQCNNCVFPNYTLESYSQTIVSLIARLKPDIVVHRITGDGPKELLIAPLWTGDKKRVLNTIMSEFRNYDLYQGKYLEDTP